MSPNPSADTDSLVLRGGLVFDSTADYGRMTEIALAFDAAGRRDAFFLIDINDACTSNTYNPFSAASGLVTEGLLQGLPLGAEGRSGGSAFYEQSSKYLLITLVDALRDAKRTTTISDLMVLLASTRAMESLLRLPIGDDCRFRLEICLEHFRRKDRNGASLNEERIRLATSSKVSALGYLMAAQFAPIFNDHTPDVVLSTVVQERQAVVVLLPVGAPAEDLKLLRHLFLTDLGQSQRTGTVPLEDGMVLFQPCGAAQRQTGHYAPFRREKQVDEAFTPLGAHGRYQEFCYLRD